MEECVVEGCRVEWAHGWAALATLGMAWSELAATRRRMGEQDGGADGRARAESAPSDAAPRLRLHFPGGVSPITSECPAATIQAVQLAVTRRWMGG